MNIIKRRYLYFGISLLLILPGLIGIALWGLPLSIDFAGGSALEIRFASGVQPPLADVRTVYADFGYPDASVRSSGEDELLIRTLEMDNATNDAIVQALETQFNDSITVLSFDTVGPLIGREVAGRAAGAIAISSTLILLYIWYAFRNVENAHRYGVAAIMALLHDVAVMFGMQAILSEVFGWEVDALFLTAMLTVIGFSVHDSIVVFDRIRENAQVYKKLPYEEMVNASIVQTLSRSINTQLTVFLVLISLAIFGGETIRHFVIILMIGLLSGTYSSIFNAAPILVVWENREWRTWFRRTA